MSVLIALFPVPLEPTNITFSTGNYPLLGIEVSSPIGGPVLCVGFRESIFGHDFNDMFIPMAPIRFSYNPFGASTEPIPPLVLQMPYVFNSGLPHAPVAKSLLLMHFEKVTDVGRRDGGGQSTGVPTYEPSSSDSEIEKPDGNDS